MSSVVVSEPQCLWPLEAELAEGPCWQDGALWFTDIKKRQIHRFEAATGQARSWDAPDQVSFVLPTADGGWVAGLPSGVHRFDPQDGAFTHIVTPEDHPAGNRLNDGYVDAEGRLWFGTMNDAEAGRDGALCRVTADGAARVQDRGYRITNGPAMSPDGRTLYHTDTLDRVIYAFDVASDGTLRGKRDFVRIARPGANPDGCFVDAEGCLWTALFGGWGLERYSPDGALLEHVPLPCSNITKAAFGGDGLTTLFVTTARLHLSEEERRAQPLSGALFSIRLSVPGLAQHKVGVGL